MLELNPSGSDNVNESGTFKPSIDVINHALYMEQQNLYMKQHSFT